MPLIRWNNKILIRNGALGTSLACCCGECCGFDVSTATITAFQVDAVVPGGINIIASLVNTPGNPVVASITNGKPTFTFDVIWSDNGQCQGGQIQVAGNTAVLSSQLVGTAPNQICCCWWEITMVDPGNGQIGQCVGQHWNDPAAWPSNNVFRAPECIGLAGIDTSCDQTTPCYPTNCDIGGFDTATFQTNLTDSCSECCNLGESMPPQLPGADEGFPE
jgi:hypothetical protein